VDGDEQLGAGPRSIAQALQVRAQGPRDVRALIDASELLEGRPTIERRLAELIDIEKQRMAELGDRYDPAVFA